MQKRKALGTRHLQGSRWHLMEARGLNEVGLFLGYPPEDVRCFMNDSRRGVKCTGCWKAYGDEETEQCRNLGAALA